MDFIEKLQNLSNKVQKQREVIQTEEATKTAFIMPFISALGYDIFDPIEVIPEFNADVGVKKGEKVDYAILRENQVIILFECKACNLNLEDHHVSQLFRYFSVTSARIGVLTNGIVYRFYTDLEAPNKMDAQPFMEFNLLHLEDALIPELKRLTKQDFKLEEILTIAGELKYTREMKRILAKQLNAPSEDFVRFLVSQVYPGNFTQSIRGQFTEIAKRAFSQFINDLINDRLRSAMSDTVSKVESLQIKANNTEDEGAEDYKRVVTTEDELQGYYIVKAILCLEIDPARIACRDTQSYFGILLDDNNRKPICRLRFDRKQKAVGLFNADKQEEKVLLEHLNDIYKLADRIKATVRLYETKPV